MSDVVSSTWAISFPEAKRYRTPAFLSVWEISFPSIEENFLFRAETRNRRALRPRYEVKAVSFYVWLYGRFLELVGVRRPLPIRRNSQRWPSPEWHIGFSWSVEWATGYHLSSSPYCGLASAPQSRIFTLLWGSAAMPRAESNIVAPVSHRYSLIYALRLDPGQSVLRPDNAAKETTETLFSILGCALPCPCAPPRERGNKG